MIKIGTTSAKSKYMKENYKMRTSVGRVQGTANAIKKCGLEIPCAYRNNDKTSWGQFYRTHCNCVLILATSWCTAHEVPVDGWRLATELTRTATRSCRTRKRALHVYSPGVAARGTCWHCSVARRCCCSAAAAMRQFTD